MVVLIQGGPTMNYADLCEAFECLTPKDKALFIDARLAWASGGAICGEVHTRICDPSFDDNNDDNNV